MVTRMQNTCCDYSFHLRLCQRIHLPAPTLQSDESRLLSFASQPCSTAHPEPRPLLLATEQKASGDRLRPPWYRGCLQPCRNKRCPRPLAYGRGRSPDAAYLTKPNVCANMKRPYFRRTLTSQHMVAPPSEPAQHPFGKGRLPSPPPVTI